MDNCNSEMAIPLRKFQLEIAKEISEKQHKHTAEQIQMQSGCEIATGASQYVANQFVSDFSSGWHSDSDAFLSLW